MGTQSHKSNSDRSRINWTAEMEQFFISIMLDQARNGNWMGYTFNKQAWNDMLITFNGNFGSLYDVNMLKIHYSNLWKQFNDVEMLLHQSGFSWDKSRKLIVAEKSTWDAHIKVNPDAQFYRSKALTNFDDLCLIYAHMVADGRYSLSSHDVNFDDDIQLTNLVGENCVVGAATKDRPKTDWTLTMDHFFVNLMLDQLKRGNKINNTFSGHAWDDMLKLFNSNFSTQYSMRSLKLRHKKLLKYYTYQRNLLEVEGFFWDEKDQMIQADDAVWENYIKANPDAHCYRKKSLLNYHDLDLIYGSSIKNRVRQQSHRRKYFEGEEKKMDSLFGNDHLACTEDLDHKDHPALLIGEEEIQSHVNGCYASIGWTPSMDRCLIDILLEQVDRLNRISFSTDDQAWIDIVALFNDRLGVQPSNEILFRHYKRLENKYFDMKDILKQRGFWWNEIKQMIIASDVLWDAYIEEHPGAKSYRSKSQPNYNDMCLIFGNSIANGLCNQSDSRPKFSNGYHWRTDWTPQMDRYFINLMLEQVQNGSMLNQKFNKQAWTDIIAKFSEDFGSQYDKDVLKSRFLNLRKQFDDMKYILDHSGFAWDEMQQRLTAEEHLWDAYVEEYPDARSFRNRNLPNFNDLYLIFGNANSPLKDSYSIATEDDGLDVKIDYEYDQSPANMYAPREHHDVTSYLDGLTDCYDELFPLSGETRPDCFVNSKSQGHNMLQIICMQSSANEIEISDHSRKRKSGSLSKSAYGEREQRRIKMEMQHGFYEESGLLNWSSDGEEEDPDEETNGDCSIEMVVSALESVPDMSDELFLEACKLLEDERKAKMFVAMDVTERNTWLSRKLRR